VLGLDEERLLGLIEQFLAATGSAKAREILRSWALWRPRFFRVVPEGEVRVEQEEREEGSIA
jgi:glutamate synthase (NADPH/NADH) large chain